jgi:CHAP domain
MADAPFNVIDGNVIQTALNAVGMKETGAGNQGAIVDWSGSTGLPWCAGFVCKTFEASGYSEIFESCSNKLYVPTVMQHGKDLGVSDTIASAPPEVGSVISFKNQSHIGIVTKVNEDGTFEITQGNTSNAVKTIAYSMNDFASGHLDKEYLSASKMDGYMQQRGVNVPSISGAGALASSNLPDSNSLADEVEDKGMVGAYDAIKERTPDFVPEEFFQYLVSSILTLFGFGDLIPQSNEYAQNEDAGREALAAGDARIDAAKEQGKDIEDLQNVTPSPTPQQRGQQSGQWL